MSYYLLNFKRNYADEFDIWGILVISEELYERFIEFRKSFPALASTKIVLPFGTNEDVNYTLNDLNFSEIESNVLLALEKIFEGSFPHKSVTDYGYWSWGHVPYLMDDINELYGGEWF